MNRTPNNLNDTIRLFQRRERRRAWRQAWRQSAWPQIRNAFFAVLIVYVLTWSVFAAANAVRLAYGG